MSETQFYSYMWLREDGTPHYVGKGQRSRAFISSGHNVHRPKDRSRILVFPQLNESEAFESEVALIRLFGRKDNDTGILRNLTDGGETPAGQIAWNKGRPWPEEVKQKVSASKKGQSHPQTEETRVKIGLAHRGKVVSEATRLKQSLAKKGKPSPQKGKKASLETRKKQSLAKLGKKSPRAGIPLSEETRLKISKATKGNKNCFGYRHSEEAKNNMSRAAQHRRTRRERDDQNGRYL